MATSQDLHVSTSKDAIRTATHIANKIGKEILSNDQEIAFDQSIRLAELFTNIALAKSIRSINVILNATLIDGNGELYIHIKSND